MARAAVWRNTLTRGGTGNQSYYNGLVKNSLAGNDRLSASRFSALQKNSAADRYEKSRYEKMEKAAGKLTQQTAALGEKVDGSGEEIDIATQAAGFVDAFNENLSNLKQSTDILDKYYHQSMKETALGNKNALEEIGITVASNGLLTLDRRGWGKGEEAAWHPGGFSQTDRLCVFQDRGQCGGKRGECIQPV